MTKLNRKKIFRIKLLLLYVYATTGLTVAAKSKLESEFLPTPTGPFAIGSCLFFSDNKLLTEKNSKQRLIVKVWYPCDSVPSGTLYNKYLEGFDLEEIYSNFKKMGIQRHELTTMSEFATNSVKDLAISDNESKYPVIVFSPGYYFGADDIYSAFIENLASNGFIVMAISHVHNHICRKDPNGMDNSLPNATASLPYLQMWWRDKTTFKSYEDPENQEVLCKAYINGLTRFSKVLYQWESNILHVVRQLKNNPALLPNGIGNKCDFDQLGMVGQSFGGAISNDMCVRFDEVKAAVNLDGFQFGCVIDSKTDKPLMLIEGDQQIRWRIGNEYIYRNYDHLEYIRVIGSLHFLFSDLPFYDGLLGEQRVKHMTGEVDGKDAITYINRQVLDFFNRSLKDEYTSQNIFGPVENDQYLYQKTNKCIYLK